MAEKYTQKRKLRNLLINKPLQHEYAALMIVLVLLAGLASGFVVHSTLKKAFLSPEFSLGKIGVYEVLMNVTNILTIKVSIVLICLVIIGGLYGIAFLHRAAGPVYRFGSLLKKTASGELPAIFRLRKKDFFKDTAVEFNNMLDYLRGKKDVLSQIVNKLDNIAEKSGSEETKKEVKKVVEELKNL